MLVYVVSIEEPDYEARILRVFSTRDKAELFIFGSTFLTAESVSKVGPWATESENVLFDIDGNKWFIDTFELDSDRVVA